MDTALPQKFPFILDWNLAKANYTENRVCTSCDTVVLGNSVLSYRNNSIILAFLKLNSINWLFFVLPSLLYKDQYIMHSILTVL